MDNKITVWYITLLLIAIALPDNLHGIINMQSLFTSTDKMLQILAPFLQCSD